MEQLIQRLETVALKLEKVATSAGTGSTSAASPQANQSAPIAAFGDFVSVHFLPLRAHATQIGGVVAEQFAIVEQAVSAVKNLIEVASISKKPDSVGTQGLIKPLQDLLEKVIQIKDKNRSSPQFNQLSVVAEGIPAFGWVVIDPTPVPYIESMRESAQFYCNRIVKEFKEKEKTQVDFAQGYLNFLAELKAYVKKYHTTGLTWNPKGGDALSAPKNVSGGEGVPLPGPPSTAKPSAGAFLSELGATNLTSGLRKVDPSQMTHKNPELRTSSVVKAAETMQPAEPKKVTPVSKAPPKLELQGNKWVVENYVNDSAIVIEKVELKHVVYVYNCSNSSIQINGKVNAITIDNCKKTSLLVSSVVSTIDVVNCKSVQVQITGTTPTMVVDKTEGLQVYVSKESINLEVFTAKSSEVNLLFEEMGEWIEKAVSEQFKTVIRGGKLESVAVEHKG